MRLIVLLAIIPPINIDPAIQRRLEDEFSCNFRDFQGQTGVVNFGEAIFPQKKLR